MNSRTIFLDTIKLYSSENKYTTEIKGKNKLNLTTPKKNTNWKMSGMNLQNFLGNIYLSNADQRDTLCVLGHYNRTHWH